MLPIEHDGKIYRCQRLPDSTNDKGTWEFWYDGKWCPVINYQICFDLNKKLKSDKDQEVENRFNYYQNGGANGPTGHGEYDCLSDDETI